MAMAFPCASPSNGCSEDAQRLGWGKNQKRLPKKPGRGVWFLQHARVLGVSGKGRKQAEDGNNAMSVL